MVLQISTISTSTYHLTNPMILQFHGAGKVIIVSQLHCIYQFKVAELTPIQNKISFPQAVNLLLSSFWNGALIPMTVSIETLGYILRI